MLFPNISSLSIREKYDTVDLARAQMKAEPIADYISEKYNVKVCRVQVYQAHRVPILQLRMYE